MRTYDLRHVVTFEDTNVVGNVHFVRYLSWQGRCRELFLRDRAPEVLAAVRDGLALVTLRCACEYAAELELGDEVEVRMSLGRLTRSTVDLDFAYVRVSGEAPAVIARGSQSVACMRRTDGGMVPEPLPEPLRAALADYS
jgi:enediyne biosynthesis thioesterase